MQVPLAELSGPHLAATLHRLRQSDPVAWIDELGGWLVTRHDEALRVMRDDRTFTVDDPRFSTAQVVGASMLSTDGTEHRRHRTPFVAPFRPARVDERFGQYATTIARDLVDTIRPSGTAELRSAVAGPMSVAVVAWTLGLGEIDTATVLRWYAAIVSAVSAITAGSAVGRDAQDAVGELGGAVRASLGDEETVLTAARGRLSDDEIVSNAAVMMFGGIETTEGMIANAVAHVLGDGEVLEAVRADPALAAAAVEESLRLEPAAAVVDRYATADVDLAGAPVARGDLVRVSLAGANRDPAVFVEPDRFELGRENVRSQLAFARGPHTCVAMDLARLEARVALRTLLERLPGLSVQDAAPATGLVFRKPVHLRASWAITSPL